MFHLKIVMIGPCKSGKTSIANIISDSTDNIGSDYRPTQGVRIVEFETQNLTDINRVMNAEVELWDCSGDLKFESLWPALYKDAHGVVFVYDPTINDVSKRMDHYFDSFVNQKNTGITLINEKNCLVIELVKSELSQPMSLSDQFSRIPKMSISLEDNGQKLRSEFAKYITSILGGVRVCNEQDEINILTVQ